MASIAPDNAQSKAMTGLAKAYAGAVIFSFPMLMTMELWQLGASLDGLRIALLTVLSIPLLTGLSRHDGFEKTSTLRDDVRDAFVAYVVGFSTSALALFMFNVLNLEMSLDAMIGRIAVQAVPAAIGAMLARALLSKGDDEPQEDEDDEGGATYVGQLFLMASGAVFLSMSVAPTEEMFLIGYKMTAWHTISLVVFSLVIMQCFTYAIEHTGHVNSLSPNSPQWSLLFRYTAVGYALVFCISYYILWTFGGFDGMGFVERVESVAVLALPAAIGSSASRLII